MNPTNRTSMDTEEMEEEEDEFPTGFFYIYL